MEEENFRTIMKYIIGLIEKDKLLESLVEKLCLRFRATRTERQWRDISYCLSLFPYRYIISSVITDQRDNKSHAVTAQ